MQFDLYDFFPSQREPDSKSTLKTLAEKAEASQLSSSSSVLAENKNVYLYPERAGPLAFRGSGLWQSTPPPVPTLTAAHWLTPLPPTSMA